MQPVLLDQPDRWRYAATRRWRFRSTSLSTKHKLWYKHCTWFNHWTATFG